MAVIRRSSSFKLRSRKLLWAGWIMLCLVSMAGCGMNMRDQFRYEPYERSTFFADDQSSRQPVANTVARGQLQSDAQLYTGKDGDQMIDTLPIGVNADVLARGQQRYNVFCAPCHGLAGDGNGVVVQRGFPAPPSLHQDRLRDAPVGHYFDVITNGFGRMYPYDYRIPVEDRWAIVAYIRALQLSQNARIEDVPAQERQPLQGAP